MVNPKRGGSKAGKSAPPPTAYDPAFDMSPTFLQLHHIVEQHMSSMRTQTPDSDQVTIYEMFLRQADPLFNKLQQEQLSHPRFSRDLAIIGQVSRPAFPLKLTSSPEVGLAAHSSATEMPTTPEGSGPSVPSPVGNVDSAATACPPLSPESLRALETWLHVLAPGSGFGTSVALQGDLPEGTGIVAKTSFAQGSLVISIPASLAITPSYLAKTGYLPLLREHPFLLHQLQTTGLTLALIIERLRGYESPWFPYIDTLPSFVSNLCWASLPHINALRGTSQYFLALRDYAGLIQQYVLLTASILRYNNSICPASTPQRRQPVFCFHAPNQPMVQHLPRHAFTALCEPSSTSKSLNIADTLPDLTHSDAIVQLQQDLYASCASSPLTRGCMLPFSITMYRWASALVMSRQNPLPAAMDSLFAKPQLTSDLLAKQADDLQEEWAQGSKEPAMGSVLSLIPGFDMGNYSLPIFSQDREINTYFNPRTVSSDTNALHALEPGDQVYLYYGHRTPAQFALFQGFIPQPGPLEWSTSKLLQDCDDVFAIPQVIDILQHNSAHQQPPQQELAISTTTPVDLTDLQSSATKTTTTTTTSTITPSVLPNEHDVQQQPICDGVEISSLPTIPNADARFTAQYSEALPIQQQEQPLLHINRPLIAPHDCVLPIAANSYSVTIRPVVDSFSKIRLKLRESCRLPLDCPLPVDLLTYPHVEHHKEHTFENLIQPHIAISPPIHISTYSPPTEVTTRPTATVSTTSSPMPQRLYPMPKYFPQIAVNVPKLPALPSDEIITQLLATYDVVFNNPHLSAEEKAALDCPPGFTPPSMILSPWTALWRSIHLEQIVNKDALGQRLVALSSLQKRVLTIWESMSPEPLEVSIIAVVRELVFPCYSAEYLSAAAYSLATQVRHQICSNLAMLPPHIHHPIYPHISLVNHATIPGTANPPASIAPISSSHCQKSPSHQLTLVQNDAILDVFNTLRLHETSVLQYMMVQFYAYAGQPMCDYIRQHVPLGQAALVHHVPTQHKNISTTQPLDHNVPGNTRKN